MSSSTTNDNVSTTPPLPYLTSTTAPGKVFASRTELAQHYKSSWHQYNCKRREAGLPLLLEPDFQQRWEAAQAIQQEKKVTQHNHRKKTPQKQESLSLSSVSNHQKKSTTTKTQPEQEDDDDTPQVNNNHPQQQEDPMVLEIDPCQSLFDSHTSSSPQDNADYMYQKYGFFVPDAEHLVELHELLGYLHEKIQIGHTCLYCQRIFATAQACQFHMKDTMHTKLAYQANVDLEDLAVFYDFTNVNQLFYQKISSLPNSNNTHDEEDDEEWEDMSDNEDTTSMVQSPEEDPKSQDSEEDEEDFMEQMGFNMTNLGELVLPDGRIIGHRAFRRYYQQRAPLRTESTAVHAARIAAGERIVQGRVVSLYRGEADSGGAMSEENAKALRHAGLAPGQAMGRAGQGLLVASSSSSSSTFTQYSIYRYRAAIRKQRQQSQQAKRVFEKTHTNINRMDKKANRLRNGVSVAHAAR